MKLLALDLETGGLDPKKNGITQAAICAATWKNGKPVTLASAHWLVRPESDLEYVPRALQIQGITLDELTSGGFMLQTVLGRMGEFVRDNIGEHFEAISPWAHNAPFDKGFLYYHAERIRWPALPFNRMWRCSMNTWYTLRDLGKHSLTSGKLQVVADHYRVPLKAHNPLSDVEATAHVALHMLNELGMAHDEEAAV